MLPAYNLDKLKKKTFSCVGCSPISWALAVRIIRASNNSSCKVVSVFIFKQIFEFIENHFWDPRDRSILWLVIQNCFLNNIIGLEQSPMHHVGLRLQNKDYVFIIAFVRRAVRSWCLPATRRNLSVHLRRFRQWRSRFQLSCQGTNLDDSRASQILEKMLYVVYCIKCIRSMFHVYKLCLVKL